MNILIRLLINLLKMIRPSIPADPGRVRIGASSNFAPGELVEVDVNGASVVVARSGGSICAVENRCPHLGAPLDGGTVRDGVVTCPLHNSTFDMCTGNNLDWVTGMAGLDVPRWSQRLISMGQEPQGVRAYRVSEEGENVYIDVAVESE
ncbi:MAG: Rieske (2Fe-2S) protein [Chloroflexota bacterium]